MLKYYSFRTYLFQIVMGFMSVTFFIPINEINSYLPNHIFSSFLILVIFILLQNFMLMVLLSDKNIYIGFNKYFKDISTSEEFVIKNYFLKLNEISRFFVPFLFGIILGIGANFVIILQRNGIKLEILQSLFIPLCSSFFLFWFLGWKMLNRFKY